jgi:hypothetical protein
MTEFSSGRLATIRGLAGSSMSMIEAQDRRAVFENHFFVVAYDQILGLSRGRDAYRGGQRGNTQKLSHDFLPGRSAPVVKQIMPCRDETS